MSEPHSKNAPGDFYVENGCCMFCAVPSDIAPNLFAWDGERHCYVARQPANDAETNQMLRAIRSAELGCIRYRGTDPQMFKRFGALGEPDLCDFAPEGTISITFRNHVTFSVTADARPWTVERLFHEFEACPPSQGNLKAIFKSPKPTATQDLITFQIGWASTYFHEISVRIPPTASKPWLMFHSLDGDVAGRSVSETIHEWLTSSACFSDIRWFAEADWRSGAAGSPSPW